jgi:hypothetical protein
MLQETIGIDDNTKVRTLTRQQTFSSNKNDFLMEILSNKLKMRDMSTQFVNNEWVNNTPKIINSNAVLSKNNAPLVSKQTEY